MGSVAYPLALPWLFWLALAIWSHFCSLYGTARTVRFAFTAEPRIIIGINESLVFAGESRYFIGAVDVSTQYD